MPASELDRAKTAARRAQVLTLTAAGFTFQQIADQVDGVGSARMAAQEVRRGLKDAEALRRLAAGTRAMVIELELARLEAPQRAVEGILRRAAAEQGKGDELVLKAAGRLVQIAEARHALLGLPGPARADAPPDELAARRRRIDARRSRFG